MNLRWGRLAEDLEDVVEDVDLGELIRRSPEGDLQKEELWSVLVVAFEKSFAI